MKFIEKWCLNPSWSHRIPLVSANKVFVPKFLIFRFQSSINWMLLCTQVPMYRIQLVRFNAITRRSFWKITNSRPVKIILILIQTWFRPIQELLLASNSSKFTKFIKNCFQSKLSRKVQTCTLQMSKLQVPREVSMLNSLVWINHLLINSKTRLTLPRRYLNWKPSFCNCQSLLSRTSLALSLLPYLLLFRILIQWSLHQLRLPSHLCEHLN